MALLVCLTTIAVDAGTASYKQSATVEEQFLSLGLPNSPLVWLNEGGSRSYDRVVAYQPPEMEFTLD